jgi:aspartyl-tRNA(Asn)/glutamyl-tRNA(Gln) amidotransferase subunit B
MIGLETHIQLNSASKLFCSCRNPATIPFADADPEPNSIVCPTCMGMPGSKPAVNEKVVEMAIKVALALNCKVAGETLFSRKTYFYPDMSKNFQITQYESPVASKGSAKVSGKAIGITRIQMEEDPAKLEHVGGVGASHVLVDYNRAGIPLLEIVTDPDFTSPQQAREYLQKLETVFEYLGVYSPATKAVMKTDANISMGSERVEVKNITGSRDIEKALEFEIVRQKSALAQGHAVKRETRMWSPASQSTESLRSKETEEDYGYIVEPDLTVITITKEKVESVRKNLPEMPDAKKARFMKAYGLNDEIAESIVSELDLANLFEDTSKKISPKVAGSWVAGYLKKTLNWNNMRFAESGLRQEWVVELLKLFEAGKLTNRNAELALRYMVNEKSPPKAVIAKYNLETGGVDVGDIVQKVVAANPKAVTDFKSGDEKAIHFLVGQCMREARGKADANELKKALIRVIGK